VIARHWIGIAKPDHADAYVDHLRRDTFPALASLAGFIDASILRRPVEDGIEFLVVTRWESLRAIEQFAGGDITRAVVPARVQAMMIRHDLTVRHYDILSE
jgi:heme-degrading monooxygenase HmoA